MSRLRIWLLRKLAGRDFVVLNGYFVGDVRCSPLLRGGRTLIGRNVFTRKANYEG